MTIVSTSRDLWTHEGVDGVDFDVPRQQILDAVDRMICDAAEDTPKVQLWIEPVELGAANQGVDCSGTMATGICSREQVTTPAERVGTLFSSIFLLPAPPRISD